jgi:hypothetical protein
VYTKQDTSAMVRMFWTSLGRYLHVIKGANGETINWLNYKTGVYQVFFRMKADLKEASVAIELQHPDSAVRKKQFDQLLAMKKIFHDIVQEEWDWCANTHDAHGNEMSYVKKVLPGVNLLIKDNWPRIISFLKPRILALDEFWQFAKERIA